MGDSFPLRAGRHPFFLRQILRHHVVQHRLGQQLLQPSVFLLEHPQTPSLGYLQPALLRLPLVECREAHAVTSAHVRRRHACPCSFKIAMSCSSLNLLRFISVRLLCIGLYLLAVTFQGRTSPAVAMPALLQRSPRGAELRKKIAIKTRCVSRTSGGISPRPSNPAIFRVAIAATARIVCRGYNMGADDG